MSDAATVHLRHEHRTGGAVAFVTIDNPGKANVLNAALMERFVRIFADLATDGALRAVVLS
ncbi:MAG TPA: hypothetical protein VFC47_03180, partial [Caulobacteraceae bacterium]|nr:hypothetical protein [Caulobacteraceae bacterium]